MFGSGRPRFDFGMRIWDCGLRNEDLFSIRIPKSEIRNRVGSVIENELEPQVSALWPG
jgi:hypothetical protein